jgi:hypothetical protein
MTFHLSSQCDGSGGANTVIKSIDLSHDLPIVFALQKTRAKISTMVAIFVDRSID